MDVNPTDFERKIILSRLDASSGKDLIPVIGGRDLEGPDGGKSASTRESENSRPCYANRKMRLLHLAAADN